MKRKRLKGGGVFDDDDDEDDVARSDDDSSSPKSSLWEVIVKWDDVCFKHILPRLNANDGNSYTE
ncbi:unnamed protein product [Bathycoccus prasinos]